MANIRALSPELQKKAIEELNEDPARIEADLKAFRDWIKKSAHINGRTDDQFLVTFLRGCKYSLEKAKQKYDLHYTLKTHVPELMKNRDPLDPKVRAAIKAGVGVVLPMVGAPDEPRYILVRTGCYDADEFTPEEIIKIATMQTDLMMINDDNYLIAGQITILDFSSITLKHFVKWNNPTFIKKMTMYQQDAIPIRQKGTHYVKMPAIALTVFNIFKTFLNEKNQSRLYVHGDDFEELYKVIPKKFMPEEYGGEAGTLQSLIDAGEKRLIDNRDFFLEDEKYGVDEKKRIGKSKNPELLFGVDGTFRRLQID